MLSISEDQLHLLDTTSFLNTSKIAFLWFLAYVLPIKVEMEMVIQQYEKAKVIQDEQLERLTQICQEQGVRHSCVCICVCLLKTLMCTSALHKTSLLRDPPVLSITAIQ